MMESNHRIQIAHFELRCMDGGYTRQVLYLATSIYKLIPPQGFEQFFLERTPLIYRLVYVSHDSNISTML